MTIGLLFTAFGLGLRHGFDWDHIAAISDLTGSSNDRRRGFMLSLWYALGHAVVVFALGLAVIFAGRTIPDALDDWMGHVVGATLILLGVWVLIDLARNKDNFRLRSRWMLIIEGTFAGVRRVRRKGSGRTVAIDHEHPHDHDRAFEHSATPAHDHSHDPAHDASYDPAPRALVPPAPGRRLGRSHSLTHGHRHHHEIALPSQADAGYGSGVAGGIGMLHGIGIESPTQIAIFVASTSVAGRDVGVLLLLAWVVGLVIANAGLAIVASLGLLHPERNARIYRGLAVVVAIASIALGIYYVAG